MSIRNVKAADLELLVKWGSPAYADEAYAELKRRAGQVEAAAEQVEPAARAGGTEAALAGPEFPKGRWTP